MKTQLALSVEFGRGGNAAACQANGWSDPEDGFTFAVGPSSALRLPHCLAPEGAMLEMEVQPFVHLPRLPFQLLMVRANGRVIGCTWLRERATLGFYLPPEMMRGDIVLSFEHPTAAQPSTVFGSNDTRFLAIQFRAVRVYAIEERLLLSEMAPSVTLQLKNRDDIEAAADELRAYGRVASETALGFESLGDNCEFGLFQRRFDVEPLGLLRFSTIYMHYLLRGLDTDFAEVGSPGRVTPKPENDDLEWMIYEDTLNLRYHSFVLSSECAKEDIIARETKKIAFLKRKLLSDLMEANKIFVCKRVDNPLTLEEVLPLYRALGRHGDNKLLWVVPAVAGYRAGTVEELLPGLFRGHIDWLASRSAPGHQSSVGWLELCAATLGLREGSLHDRRQFGFDQYTP